MRTCTACTTHLPTAHETLVQRLDKVEGELHEPREAMEKLNCHLDGSRQLDLRSAELLDLAFSQLAK